MWKFLASLPVPVSVGLIGLGILAIIVIALRGKIKAKFGNKEIDIGKEDFKESIPSAPPVSGVLSVRKYSCGDCVLMLMSKRENYEMQVRKEEDHVLKNQMTYTEQKISDLQMSYMEMISKAIHDSVKNNTSTVEESVQYKLVDSLLKDAMVNVKNEIRRSFKDNGFYDMDNSDFYSYVKDRTKTVGGMIHQYFRSIYPDRGGVITIYEILFLFEEKQLFLSSLISDVYNNAQEVKRVSEKKIFEIKEEFKAWLNEFTAPINFIGSIIKGKEKK
jgi:hypothetical protein